MGSFDKICLAQHRTDYSLHCSRPIQEDILFNWQSKFTEPTASAGCFIMAAK